MQNKELFERTIKTFGSLSQGLKFLEEIAEAQVEWTKNLQGFGRRENLLGELADLQIMLNQIIIMVGDDDFNNVYEYKLNMLAHKINKRTKYEAERDQSQDIPE